MEGPKDALKDLRPPVLPSSIRLDHGCKDIVLLESLSLRRALLPPAPPSGFSEIGARGPGRRRASAGRGVQPPRPLGGVWACPRLPTRASQGGNIEEERGRGETRRREGRKEAMEGRKEGREGKSAVKGANPASYGAGGLKPGSRLILGFFKARRTVVGVAYSLRA